MAAGSAPSRTVEAIVGARLADDASVAVTTRAGGTTARLSDDVHPWVIAAHPDLPTGSPEPLALSELTGDGELRTLVQFRRWSDVWAAVRAYLERERALHGRRVSNFADLPHLYFTPDPVDQWLIRTGNSFFRGMTDTEVISVVLDIRTDGGLPDLRTAQRPEGAVRSFTGVLSSGASISLRARQKDEPRLLADACAWIAEQDPDIVVARDLHGTFLPFLFRRCQVAGVEAVMGRDELPLRPHTTVAFRNALEVPGRTTFDLSDAPSDARLLGLLAAGAGYAPLPSRALTGLRTLATTEGLAPKERAKRDLASWSALFELLLPLVQRHALSPEHLFRSTAGARFEAYAIARSLRTNTAVPGAGRTVGLPEPVEQSFRTGLYAPVAECLLSPVPAWLLAKLSDDEIMAIPERFREVARRTVGDATASDPDTLFELDLQQGLADALATRTSRFASEAPARSILSRRSSLAQDVERRLGVVNVRVFQTLDDLLLVQLPDNAADGPAFDQLWKRVSESLPEGLHFSVIGRYRSAVSLGPRIFSVRRDTGMLHHRRARIPRFFEPFIREFFYRAMDMTLREDWTGLHGLFQQTYRLVRSHGLHVADFCRHETLSESVAEYEQALRDGKRHPSAAFEAVKRRYPEAEGGMTVRYYITGTRREVLQAENSRLAEEWDSAAPDENAEYYADRLLQCAERFRALFEPDSFERVFSPDDLFGFDPRSVRTVQRDATEQPAAPRRSDPGTGGISILLDTDA